MWAGWAAYTAKKGAMLLCNLQGITSHKADGGRCKHVCQPKGQPGGALDSEYQQVSKQSPVMPPAELYLSAATVGT